MNTLCMEAARENADLASTVREGLSSHRQRLELSLKQASVVAAVFALGVAFHIMKWTGLILL